MEELEKFLPYVDNWATCDQMSPKIFRKNKEMLLQHIEEWIKSDRTYTVRFGVGMLMEHFLDEDYDPKYPETVAKIIESKIIESVSLTLPLKATAACSVCGLSDQPRSIPPPASVLP